MSRSLLQVPHSWLKLTEVDALVELQNEYPLAVRVMPTGILVDMDMLEIMGVLPAVRFDELVEEKNDGDSLDMVLFDEGIDS